MAKNKKSKYADKLPTATTASNMDVPVGDRAAYLQHLGRQQAQIDAAIGAFKKSGRVSFPTSADAGLSMLVSMDVTTKKARKLFLRALDGCRARVEEQMAEVLADGGEA